MKAKYLILSASALIVASMASCGGHKEQTPEHQHDAHITLTAYTPDYEFYVVAEPFVNQKVTDVTLYVTRLSDFKPLPNASVTASLSSDNQTVDSASEPGVFKFRLTPSTPSALTFKITSDSVFTVVMPFQSIYSDEHEAHEAAEAAEVGSNNSVIFDKKQGWMIDFATAPVIEAPFGKIIKSSGRVSYATDDSKVSSASVPGFVSFQSSSIAVGQKVRAGERILTISNKTLVDNNLSTRMAAAKAEYDAAEEDFRRKNALIADRLVTRRELTEARSRRDAAKAEYSSLSSNYSGGYQSVSAPFDGFISAVNVSNGQFVETGTPLFTVSRNNKVLVEASTPASNLPYLSSVRSANLATKSSGVFTLDDVSGRIVSVSSSADSSDGMVRVTFEAEKSDALVPGSFIDTYIITESLLSSTLVPSSALIEEMGSYFVYVQLTPELFEKRPVRIGQTDGLKTEVLSGVFPGERVVSKGAMVLKLAQTSGKLDAHAGHVH